MTGKPQASGHVVPPSEDLLTLGQAALLLDVEPATLRAQIHRGRLHARKLGRDWIVDQSAVERYRREIQRKRATAATPTR